MFHIFNKKIKCLLFAITIFSVCLGPISSIQTARAQGTNVPIGTSFDFNSIMSHLKEFTLDRAASMLAKQILHQMTLSVVNWINSGFHGSPSFITNPKAFFLDAADQVTGAFIAANGPLASLCSPFNIDIRLSLALNLPQNNLYNQRYTCTLGSIIGNAKNGNLVTVNGQSINGFMSGDFNQGSWPAFIALTTEPQNNPYGAYLIAQSDLGAQINARRAAIHADVAIGGGFMSWQDCKDIPGASSIDQNDYNGMEYGDSVAQGDPSVTSKTNSDGTITYQSCTTQTPGSVIAGTLQKQMNVPADELELANDINSVFNALVTQMVSQVLNKGLGAISGGSGGNPSYTSQVQTNLNVIYTQEQAANNEQASAIIDQAAGSISQYKMYYDEALSLINTSKQNYQNAINCFTSKSLPTVSLNIQERNYADGQISTMQSIIANSIDPIITKLNIKIAGAQDQLAAIKSTSLTTPSIVTSETQLNNQQAAISNSVQAAIDANSTAQTNLVQAKKDFADAQAQAKSFDAGASQYQNACNNFPNISSYGNY